MAQLLKFIFHSQKLKLFPIPLSGLVLARKLKAKVQKKSPQSMHWHALINKKWRIVTIKNSTGSDSSTATARLVNWLFIPSCILKIEEAQKCEMKDISKSKRVMIIGINYSNGPWTSEEVSLDLFFNQPVEHLMNDIHITFSNHGEPMLIYKHTITIYNQFRWCITTLLTTLCWRLKIVDFRSLSPTTMRRRLMSSIRLIEFPCRIVNQLVP